MSNPKKKRLSFERGAGFLLSRLGKMAERDWARVIDEVELTQTEFYLLTVLEEVGSIRQRELAIRAALDPRNAVASIARLTARGLIVSMVDKADRRVKGLAISLKGRSQLDMLRERLASERAVFFGPLTSKEYQRFCILLLRLYDARVQKAKL
jgi:DNA-binding MarR family transcriptional regulator